MLISMTNDVRFWERVCRGDASGCWLWQGEVRKPSGFGAYCKRLAHRVAWELSGRPSPTDTLRHTCSNKTCVNPDHLYEAVRGAEVSPLQDRFWKFVDKTSTCWCWTGARHTSGYGRIGRGGAGAGMEYAHRASWQMHVGEIPAGHYVAHTCDVKTCVNPAHLFLSKGNDENMADASEKNRIAHGERSGLCKFSDEQIKEVRDLIAQGLTQQQVASRLNMSRPYVSEIASGKKRRRETTVPIAGRGVAA